MSKPLTIESPRQGISASPLVGYGDVRQLDIFSVPGVARLNNLTAKKSSTTVVGRVNWMVKNPTTPAEVYALDADGKLYKSADSGATWALVAGNSFTVTIASPAVFSATAHGLVANDTVVFATTGALPTGLTAGTTYYVIAAGLTADAFQVSTSQGGSAVNTTGTQSGTHTFKPTLGMAGQGLAIWKGYVFVARAARLDVYSGSTWTNNWKTIDSDALWHPMFVSKNDSMLYGGAGKYVFSVEELTTFAPATAASFTFTSQALDLPPNYRIKCIEELGNNLMLGTWQGTNVYDLRVADIFPWDRSASSFGQPITLNDFGVHALLNTGNSLIVLAGIDGQVYLSDGVGAVPVAQIPQSIADISGGKYLDFYPGAICNWKRKVYFGVSSGGTATSIAGMGVYSLTRTSKGNILVNEHLISTGSDGDGEIVKIGALVPVTRDNLLIGWQDATAYGIDNITVGSYATTYTGYFTSPLYRVGTSNHTRKFQEVEINLARPLRSNEGIKLSYRSDLTASFTDFLTWDYATYAGELSHTTILSKPTFDIPASELLQIKVSLTGTTTTPDLISVTLG